MKEISVQKHSRCHHHQPQTINYLGTNMPATASHTTQTLAADTPQIIWVTTTIISTIPSTVEIALPEPMATLIYLYGILEV